MSTQAMSFAVRVLLSMIALSLSSCGYTQPPELTRVRATAESTVELPTQEPTPIKVTTKPSPELPTPTPVLREYALLGTWEGYVSYSSMQVGEGQFFLRVEITKTQSGNLVATISEEGSVHILSDGEWKFPINGSNRQYYCFPLYDSSGTGMQVGDRCFSPTTTNQLDYMGGDLLGESWGTLKKTDG